MRLRFEGVVRDGTSRGEALLMGEAVVVLAMRNTVRRRARKHGGRMLMVIVVGASSVCHSFLLPTCDTFVAHKTDNFMKYGIS